MTERQSRGSRPETRAADLRIAIDDYLTDKGKGPSNDSGTYRRNAGARLEEFAEWVEDQGVASLDEIDARTLRRYARDDLLQRDLAPGTVHKYFDYLSAFIGWCEREGLVQEHHGIKTVAREPLPDLDERKRERQQSWQPEDRTAILRFVDDRAHEAIDAEGETPLRPLRDRAMVAILAYSGVRGSELLANPDDDRRTGATWDDLGNDYATLTVLSKDQSIEERAVPPQARPPIQRWEDVLDPARDWPIIPTFQYAALYEPLWNDAAEDLDGHEDIFDAYRDRNLSPAGLTTGGARTRMQDLTDAAEIDVDEGYLQLHGARRGAGRVLALEQGIDAAADQLSDSVRVVEEAYSDVLAEERAEKTGQAFELHDGTNM